MEKNLKTIVVSASESSRMTTSFLLKDLGISRPVFVEKLEEFKKAIEDSTLSFDLIVSDLSLAPSGGLPVSALDILDAFRQSSKNSLRTCFIILAEEAEYRKVADGIDGAVDDFLIKPFSCSEFSSRLQNVFERKKTFEPIFKLMDENALKEAAALSLKLFEEAPRYKVFSARIATELLTATGQHEKTAEVFNILLKEKALPWTKLGIAKAELESKNCKKARRSLEVLVAENPSYVDAYDILGRSQIESLDFQEAFLTYKKALELTPANIQRVQKFASISAVVGRDQEALIPLDRAFNSSVKSDSLDLYCVFLLAYFSLKHDHGKALEKCEKHLRKKHQDFNQSVRISTLLKFVENLTHLRANNFEKIAEFSDSFNEFVFKKDFDFETCCAALLFIKQIRSYCFFKNYMPNWVKHCFMRFNVSKTALTFFEYICEGDLELAMLLKTSSSELSGKCQKALSMALEKQQKNAIKTLILLSEETLNTKVFNLAKSALDRYKGVLDHETVCELNSDVNHLQGLFSNLASGLKEEIFSI